MGLRGRTVNTASSATAVLRARVAEITNDRQYFGLVVVSGVQNHNKPKTFLHTRTVSEERLEHRDPVTSPTGHDDHLQHIAVCRSGLG